MNAEADEQILRATPEEQLRVLPPGSGLSWYCLYTRPRHEKAVARTCASGAVDFYLPLRRVVRHYKSRKKVCWLPLFSGYVFCCADESRVADLSSEDRILTVIGVVDQETFVEELRQIYRGLKVSSELGSVPYLAEGRRVEITRGPFRGIRGVVEEVKGRFRVMLTATMMESSVPLEIDAGDVEPME